MKIEVGHDVRGYGHTYGTLVEAVDTERRMFKIKDSSYWDSFSSWHSFDEIERDKDDPTTWIKK